MSSILLRHRRGVYYNKRWEQTPYYSCIIINITKKRQKSSILIVLTLEVLLFVFSTVNNNAQCAPGWSFATRSYVVPMSTCTLTISYCYKCSPTSGIKANVKISGWTQSGDCESIDMSNNLLLSLFIADYSNLCIPPDCGSGCDTLLLEIPACRQWYYDQSTNPISFRAYWEPCLYSSKWCTIKTPVCRDSNGVVIECGGGLGRVAGSYGTACPTYESAPTYPQTLSGYHLPYNECTAGDACP